MECAGRSGSFVSLLAPSDPRFGSLLASQSKPGGFPPNQLILIRSILIETGHFSSLFANSPSAEGSARPARRADMADARGAAALGEQFFQPLGNLFGRVLLGEAGGEAALRVHHIDDRAVVHRIVAAGFGVLCICLLYTSDAADE